MELIPFSEAASCATTQEFPPHFMERKGPLQCSHEPSIGSYPQVDQASPYHPILYL
jgi:hypothetical protein